MPEPPRAPRRPTVLRAHDDERIDDWYWLRDRDDPDVRSYLEAENTYTAAAVAHTAALQASLYNEIIERVQETDASTPVPDGPYEYFRRTIAGSQYGVFCRRPARTPELPDALAPPGSPAGEQIVVDENVLAAGNSFFALGALAVSPDHRLAAYSVDTSGAERYELRFRDLGTGADLADVVPDTYYGLAWAADSRSVLYVRPDDVMRPYQVWHHVLAEPVIDDTLIYQEDDERFNVSVALTRTRRYAIITSDSRMTSEVRLVDATDPTAPARLVEARRQGVEYAVEHHVGRDNGDRLFIVTNDDGATGFKLMAAPVASPGRASWREMVGSRDDVRLDAADAFADHIVLSERADGLERLRVLDVATGDAQTVALPDPVYSVWLGPNAEFDTPQIRYGYTSLVQPPSTFEYDSTGRNSTLVKRQPVPNYQPDEYESHRSWATAPDGAKVPISLVHRRGLERDGSAPALLYGYGSYEASIDPTFSTARVSLLERGFVFAIAHVRGGGEMGRAWYESGRLAQKPNTFTDFIACAEHLIAEGITSADRLAARGGSAGGLLMGAVVNLRPDLFRAVIAEVPFVDCLTTILDENLPLTVNEWEEWGNPVVDSDIYFLMKAYSPYDNVEAKDYPAMLVTAGLHDPRVQYWEPAKWVAKLRALKSDDSLLLLKTEMGAGHRGPSGRYDAWRDEAFALAFVLNQLGFTEKA
ncbi:MAG: S9 family peptidase [Acidimicrobiia bacterium]